LIHIVFAILLVITTIQKKGVSRNKPRGDAIKQSHVNIIVIYGMILIVLAPTHSSIFRADPLNELKTEHPGTLAKPF
jgi:hypothetical protein